MPKLRNMQKLIEDFVVTGSRRVGKRHELLRLRPSEGRLPAVVPGQFVEIRVDGEPQVFLRRPLSVCNVDDERGELWLLVAAVGPGTRRIASVVEGDRLNCVLPLGNGFPMPTSSDERIVLIGGGVGVAPLLYMAKTLRANGIVPTIIIGAKSADEVLLADEFSRYGAVYVTTEDGSCGERGYVTSHSVLGDDKPASGGSHPFNHIYACGPKPMMLAVTRYARLKGAICHVSLENMMACGIGACLCCVEPTVDGNRRVCADGPVFNINDLLWQI